MAGPVSFRDIAPQPKCQQVGWGFTERGRVELSRRLLPLARSAPPFRDHATHDVCWVRPVLVGQMAYREFTGKLRHPWEGADRRRPRRGPRSGCGGQHSG